MWRSSLRHSTRRTSLRGRALASSRTVNCCFGSARQQSVGCSLRPGKRVLVRSFSTEVPKPSDLITETARALFQLQEKGKGDENRAPVWFDEESSSVVACELLEETTTLLDRLESFVETGVLLPEGKHRHATSVLMEGFLKVCALSGDVAGAHSLGSRVLKLIDTWQIDRQHTHVEPMVEIEARSGHWKEAASLYMQRIDPDQAGFNPMVVDVSNPIGLYAVARADPDAAFHNTLHAVSCLRMVSPEDQGQCTFNVAIYVRPKDSSHVLDRPARAWYGSGAHGCTHGLGRLL